MSHIIPFPAPDRAAAPRPPVPPCNVHRRRFMELSELAGRLGLGDRTRRTIIDNLRALARHRGLPLPVNPRLSGGVPATGADAICAFSRWDRGVILAWLDYHQAPPAQPAAARDADHAATRRRLAANARRHTAQGRGA